MLQTSCLCCAQGALGDDASHLPASDSAVAGRTTQRMKSTTRRLCRRALSTGGSQSACLPTWVLFAFGRCVAVRSAHVPMRT